MASAINVAPTAVILVASATCVWPYLMGEETTPPPVAPAVAKAGEKGKAVSEITTDLLNPVLPPRPVRNPFIDREALRTEAHNRIAKMLKTFEEARAKATRLEHAKHLAKTSKNFANKGNGLEAGKGVGMGEGKPGVLENSIGELVLGGTSVGTARGAAVINGKTYVTGDPIATADSSEKESVVLAEVHRGHVVLHYKGEKHELKYSTPSRGESVARATGKAAPVAKKGGKAFDPFHPR